MGYPSPCKSNPKRVLKSQSLKFIFPLVPHTGKVDDLPNQTSAKPVNPETSNFDMTDLRETLIGNATDEYEKYHEHLMELLEQNTKPNHHTYTNLFLDCDKCRNGLADNHATCVAQIQTFRRGRQLKRNSETFRRNNTRTFTELTDKIKRLRTECKTLQSNNYDLKREFEYLKKLKLCKNR